VVLGLAGLLGLGALPVWAHGGQLSEEQKGPLTVAVDHVTLKDAEPDRVHLDVEAHVTASRKMKIKRIRFEHMRLAGIPVFLAPVEDEVVLEKDVPQAMPEIPLTVYLRDVHSLDPLIAAVRDGQARVQGQGRAELDANLLERAAAGQWTVQADMPIDMTAPVEVPGGTVGRTAVLGTLAAAQAATALGSVFGLGGGRASDSSLSRYEPMLLVAESRYTLELKDHQRIDVTVRGMGFRVSEDRFAVTGEMLEPWRYDLDAATAIQKHDAKVVEGSADLRVWPAGEAMDASTARSLAGGQIEVVKKPGGTERTRVPEGEGSKEIRLARRDANGNLAVLRFKRDSDKGTGVMLADDDTRHAGSWEELTLFRVGTDGKLERLTTPARREDESIVLGDPVDDSAFGSVLLAGDRAVGMVQDERAGVVWGKDRD
jgi:hypothetical protein